MNLNKKLIIVVFAVIFASCSTNNNIQVIDSENIKIEELEKNFNRVIGNGVLQGKGKSNFSSPFIFESSGNNSIIVFKDFLGRRQYMIEVNNDSIRYLNVRKKVEISQEEFNRFFPLSNQLNSNFNGIDYLKSNWKGKWGVYPNLGITEYSNDYFLRVNKNTLISKIRKIINRNPDVIGLCCGSTINDIKLIKQIMEEK